MSRTFPVGTVGHMLVEMSGVWHDHLEVFDLAGNPLEADTAGGTGGDSPFDNLVYIEFDGEIYKQTNVTFRGRPLHVRSFTGKLINGVLHFDKLGPRDPGHIGVAAGPGVLIFTPRTMDDALKRYSEPDTIHLIAPNQRVRSTLLYKDGIAVRTLNARGYKIAPVADRRVTWDPRGTDGEVHEIRSVTQVFDEDS